MFDKQDEAFHKGLVKLLDEATYELKAREVQAFAQVYSWAKALLENIKTKHEAALKKVENDLKEKHKKEIADLKKLKRKTKKKVSKADNER